jgi:hypothetical protein
MLLTAVVFFMNLAFFSQMQPVMLGTANKASNSSSQTFRIVVLPDTQNYQGTNANLFSAQTQWIVNNHAALNIEFVIHEGDIVNDNQASQWENAQTAMRILDGVVPYSITPGNHDMGTNGSANTRDTTLFNQYFPLSHYSGTATFGGVYTAEPTKYENNYHIFNAGGTDWLVLSLEFGPRNEVLTWANQVVSSHPNHRVIVVTHIYIWSNETRHDTSESWNPHSYGVSSQPGGVNDGEEMWQKFVRKHANISFVLNGHVLNDGQGRLVSVGDHGNRVYQMLCNYQTLPNGGNAYLRVLEFDPVQRRVSATSYSPSLDNYLTDWQNQFVFENVDLGPPSGAPTNVLYDENFDDGAFTGYTIVDEGLTDAPSNWQWVNGEIVQSSNIYGPNSSAVSNRQGTFAVYNNPAAYNWSNYRFEATLRSTDDDGIGAMFYYQNPSNYYKLDLDRQRNFYKLFSKVNGVETTLANVPGQYNTNDGLDISIEVQNGQIRVRLDETDIFGGPISDSSLTSGTIALYSWGNQNSVYDDILVETPELSSAARFWK